MTLISSTLFFSTSELLASHFTQEVTAASKGKGKGKRRESTTAPEANESTEGPFVCDFENTYSEWREKIQDYQRLVEEYKSELDQHNSTEPPEYGCDIEFSPTPQFPSFQTFEETADELTLLPKARTESPGLTQSRHTSEKATELPTIYDRGWLLDTCREHLLRQNGHTEPETTALFCEDLVTVLNSQDNDEQIQASLVDLLGFESFDLITTLITNRQQITSNIGAVVIHQAKAAPNEPPPEWRPSYGTQFTVQSEAEKLEQKQLRKERKKAAGLAVKDDYQDFDTQELRRLREESLNMAASTDPFANLRKSTNAAEKYPHVYQSGPSGNTLSLFGTRFALPQGTIREDFTNYEEITIPIAKVAPPRVGEKPVAISSMDILCQNSFKGYTSLNRVQSIVYPIAYKTNENMLICAPTGAGKTEIAMLSVLRTLSLYCTPAPGEAVEGERLSIAKRDFKIVYVAPMKALAAEIVRKIGSRLKWLDIQVRELTGDMQLTKSEILNTQIIVTTPEKWDVVTRKSTGDVELAQKVRLLIIDEVHLLHDDRGSVIESIVARTLRQVESSQSMIRIVGLSATLPNYIDVASFLRVDPYQGLFFFDSGFRPVPLEQHFLGVKGKTGSLTAKMNLDKACFDKCHDLIRNDHQIMVFVHARKETVKTAQMLSDMALSEGITELFDCSDHPRYELAKREVAKSRNRELKELFNKGFAMHHAGMLRSDRNLVERLFADGLVKVLCCTATLAWGVNLPAYAVIIKGTQVYDAQKGSFVDLSILDVLQIFGRAGRPQYESHGEGYIITNNEKLSHYVSSMTQQHPIESMFIENIIDNLNAEICLGTVTNVDEAVTWLSYTYLYVRMKKNPLVYGMNHSEPVEDPLLGSRRRDIIVSAAQKLHQLQMIIFDAKTGFLTAKDLGRIASSFYLQHTSVEIFNNLMKPRMTEADVLAMISLSTEFDNIKVREEESKELTELVEYNTACAVKGGTDNTYGKVNILLQAGISRAQIEDFALVSDSAYVMQNGARITRALFEIAMNRNWGPVTAVLLSINKSIDKRMWSFEHPLAQLGLNRELIQKLDAHPHRISIEEMRDMTPNELGELVHHVRMGSTIAHFVKQFPVLELDASIAPITRNVLRVQLTITPDFVWNDNVHGSVEPWWIWVEDADNTEIYHSEYFLLSKRTMKEAHVLGFTIPVSEPLPNQIFIRAVSDKWIGAETLIPVSFKHLILPELQPQHTDLLDLQPLPITALHDEVLEGICAKRFYHFNPVQTQIFHTLYHTEHNALIGAPTGSGKTVAAELSMWGAFKAHPGSKVVYIAPLKALVRERVQDWKARLTGPMNKKLVELTGDVTPDLKTIQSADIIITTPEKWDGISRGWQNRSYVKAVSLVIIDEIHLLGGDRGPILEVIVSRMNYIGSQIDRKVRIVGLSTALANATDLGDWLGIKEVGLFNFRHSVRPVPLEIYIDGFPGKHYCPRMASMNKPTYAAIKTHSPNQPVIVFVSSRRQTRLTAQDLMAFCAMEDDPRRFLHIPEDELNMLLLQVQNPNLKLCLGFGIGLHHAGLTEVDRKIVEELFVNQKIQILIATSTLAWGVNFPAHLVVVKGTEFFDAKKKGYVDFPITDVLQMMGRAGRPQFDNTGIARIFVSDSKKNFYKKFLHEPFPVESSLHLHLEDHFSAEIVAGTIRTKQDAMDYLTWTYFYRRLKMNPTYYGLEEVSEKGVNLFLSEMIEKSLGELVKSSCAEFLDDIEVAPTDAGKIASHYYLSHITIRQFLSSLKAKADFVKIMRILCDAYEYEEFPVRHEEDLINKELEKELPHQANLPYDSPHAKSFLLLQAHFSRLRLPISDYMTDTISVLDQSIRILQAMVDIAATQGYLTTCLEVMAVMQSIKQGRWPTDHSLLMLPHLSLDQINQITFKNRSIRCTGEVLAMVDGELEKSLRAIRGLNRDQTNDILRAVGSLPVMEIKYAIRDARSRSLSPDTEYQLEVTVHRKFPSKKYQPKETYDGRAYCAKFAKPQYEGWWIALGDAENDDLMAIRRISMQSGPGQRFSPTSTVRMSFVTPEAPGTYRLTLFLMSDAYMGLDQQYDLTLNVE
ncbi:Sec63-domain-containing protein [Basidiobolus meristosporus CBS 931.73]|uniref:Sec63-domain-containing protein n=1 Tax=Basidiobolus meristosporus CBS 931.73 TaxID=1314790 RepID=A0A1Y1XMZ8_9FUNG|nr:Sec63-domain-containing protein [Basidiobolus meristosporus CBS 931.73]|eukprot:ORX87093.1 Sec63-domain-containing protein [Basidiobolus meristosporus CBS 931.73]